MIRLILFDVDGTLLNAGGAGARALLAAIDEVFDRPVSTDSHSFAGKTDPQIAKELLGSAGVAAERIAAGLPRLWPVYLRRLPAELEKTPPVALPGVLRLLDALARDGDAALVGLLTGNLRAGAELKLNASGIGFDRFRVGAFGSDHHDRAELPEIARRRAGEVSGRPFRGEQMVIVGDTPYDVRCGERLGVRTVAVATGGSERSVLAACAPDHLFDTLGDHRAVRHALLPDRMCLRAVSVARDDPQSGAAATRASRAPEIPHPGGDVGER